MLVIRLQRTGRKNVPAFRLVVAQHSAPIKGKVTEYIGYYLPTRNPHVFEFDEERVSHWIKMGAQPTDTVARLLAQGGVSGLEKYMTRYTKKKSKKEPEEEPEAPAAEAPAASADEEAPAAEEATAEPPAETPKEEPAEEPKKEEESAPEEAANEDDKSE